MTQASTTPASSAKQDPEPLLQVEKLSKSFRMGDARVDVLRGVDLAVSAGEFIAIEGRSGSGKSTLLHLMGALDTPDAGSVQFGGRDLTTLSGRERNAIRNREVGFVFQFYHLLPELNVLENTMLAGMVGHSVLNYLGQKARMTVRATELLEAFGLSHRMGHRPAQLSGGERQRVAIARALMNEPKLLLADEPTGNLDAETGAQIMQVLADLHRDRGQTLVLVTHDHTLAQTADRALFLKEGKLQTR